MLRSLVTVAACLVMPSVALADMFKINVASVTIQDVGDDDKPKGKETPVKTARPTGGLMCQLSDDPKSTTFTAWIQAHVDDGGKTRMTHSKGGAPDDVISCVSQYVANMKLPVKESGEYRVTAKATFTRAKCDTRGICH